MKIAILNILKVLKENMNTVSKEIGRSVTVLLLYTGNFIVFMKNKSQYCDFPGSIPILALKIAHSGKPYSPRHATAVGYPLWSH